MPRPLMEEGFSYEGEFKLNKPDGFIVFKNNEACYQGMMKNFKFLSNSPLVIAYQKQIIEIIPEQEFNTLEKNERPNEKYNKTNNLNNSNNSNSNPSSISGLGIIKLEKNNIYEGYIKNLNQNDLGVLRKEEMVCQGYKVNKQYNGYCEIFYRDGTRFSGNFRNNKKQGLGCFISKDNVVNISEYSENYKNGASITQKKKF